jgi:hypothetical protein
MVMLKVQSCNLVSITKLNSIKSHNSVTWMLNSSEWLFQPFQSIKCFLSSEIFQFLKQKLQTSSTKTVIMQLRNSFISCFIRVWNLVSSTWKNSKHWGIFENRVLRTTFGPKIKHIAGDSTELHDCKLHYVYFWPYIYRHCDYVTENSSPVVYQARSTSKLHSQFQKKHRKRICHLKLPGGEGKTMENKY